MRTERRRLALVVVAVLVAAAVPAGHWAGRQVAPAAGPSLPGPCEQARAAAPGPGSAIGVGATVQTTGGAGWAEAFHRADVAYGPVTLFRVFYPGLPPPWPGSAADLAGRAVHVSFKAPPPEIVAGVHDDALAAWFASMPPDRDIYWTYHHEPENNIEAGEFTADSYRAAWQRVAALAGRVEHPRRCATLVLMGWTLEPAAGRDWRDYYPGADVIDVLGWDIYNLDFAAGDYSDPPAMFERAVAAARSEGKPWGIAEFGSRRVPGDEPGHQRASWIRQVADHLSGHPHPPLWVAWYDALIGDGEDYRLVDEPSRSAWRDFVHSQPAADG